MTDAGKRTFQILSGVRRARELLVSRESSLATELAGFSGEMLRQAAADLHEITSRASAMHRACEIELANNELSATADAAAVHGADGIPFGEKMCLEVFQL